MTRYHVTKYALTGGIDEIELDADNSFHGYAFDRRPGRAFSSYKIGRDCFLSRDTAVKDAEARRIKKIASLKKQIAALEKLKWS